MSDKYTIRNCPCFFEENEEVNDYTCAWSGTEELACQDCTDCVLKQIVELCKDKQQSRVATNILSNRILKLLDIQEILE